MWQLAFFRDSGSDHGSSHSSLNDGLVQVVAAPARKTIRVLAGRAEDPSPLPLASGARLDLSRWADATVDGQVAEELLHGRGIEILRVPLAMKEDEPADPTDVCDLGSPAQVANASRTANLLERAWLLGRHDVHVATVLFSS